MTTGADAPDCPMCRSPRTKRLFAVGEYSIWRCSVCRGGFATPVPSPSEVRGVYGDRYGGQYLDGVMHSEAFAQVRFDMVRQVLSQATPGLLTTAGRKALDVGCGSGRFLGVLGRAGWQTVGVEMSPPLAEYAREEMRLEVVQADFLDAPLDGRYNLVTMFHIIEHFADPAAAVRRANDLLDKGGVVLIETPNWESIGARLMGRRWSHYIPPEHLVYFGPRAIVSLAAACGFSTRVCRTWTPPILQSIAGLPRPIRDTAAGVYRLAARAGVGPALQYVGVKR